MNMSKVIMDEIHGWREDYLRDGLFEHAESCDVFEDLVDGLSKGFILQEVVPSIRSAIGFSAKKGGEAYTDVAARVFEVLDGYG
jgi:hypothetical protein